MRVLLVDDHPAMRLGVRSALQVTEGVEVVGEAETAGEAIRLATELLPDLVILDLRLKGEEGGIEACREVKSLLPSPPKVLVYTAYSSPEDVSSALLANADSYLHKGADYGELVEAVERTCAGERVWLLSTEIEEAEAHLQRVSNQVDLTPKEKEILLLLLKRYSNAEIAEELCVSLSTVKTHVRAVARKTGTKSRRELSRPRRPFFDTLNRS